MNNCSEEREDQFYDAREELSSSSDCDLDCSEESSLSVLGRLRRFEVWAHNLENVQERRQKFIKWMGLDLERDFMTNEEIEDSLHEKAELGIDRLTEDGGAVLRTSGFEDELFTSQSSEAPESSGNGALEESLNCKVEKLDDGREFKKAEPSDDGIFELRRVGSKQLVSNVEFQRNCSGPPSSQQVLRREVEDARYNVDARKKVKRGWLQKLGIGMCVVDRNWDALLHPGDLESTLKTGMHRVRVHPCRKRTKELSSLYAGQEFQAHEGSILTMKFSPDGRYLASGGEDGVVRVWKVNEVERSDKFNVDAASDSSNVYFTMDQLSKLDLLDVETEKNGKGRRMKRSSDSACVILPPNIFHILEKPLHEFRGHSGDILDLSWSDKGVSITRSFANLYLLFFEVMRHIYFGIELQPYWN